MITTPAVTHVTRIVRVDFVLHDEAHPFCGETLCPCHADFAAHDREIMQPWLSGLLTEEESARIFYGKQV